MDSHYFMPSSSCSLHPGIHTHPNANSAPAVLNPPRITPSGFRISNSYFSCLCYHHHQKKQKSLFRREPFGRQTRKWGYRQLDKNRSETGDSKKGSLAGAIALVIGTSIGSGILALPQKASPAGFVPSSVSIIVCWAFLLIEALLLVEINVAILRKRKRKRKRDEELEGISIRTMAQETLGEWGGALATVTNVVLGYSCMAAYCSKSGDLLFQWIYLPAPVSGCLFTAFFTMLISIGGTQATDRVNQWLTASMIGLLLAIEVLAVEFGGWSGIGGSDWAKVPAAMPVIIFSLVYHDITPGDLDRIKASIFLGSLVPLMALLIWDAIAVGLAAEVEQIVDPIDLLFRVKWSGVSVLVGAFSLLAVGTSLIGTLLSFSEFFKEQLKNLGGWWGRNKMSIVAMTIVVAPSLFVSTTFPDAFSAATDIAGGYCMTVLYGVLPPAMAWTMQKREYEGSGAKSLSEAWPALIMVSLFACGIVVDQILQDTQALHL